MNENMSFYQFMHKQILVVILLFIGTGPGYIMMGYLYSSMIEESVWFLLLVSVSIWGFKLYKNYSRDMTIEQKDIWLQQVRYFMFTYFSLWSVMFVVYVLKDNTNQHYIGIATQLGTAVVAATILASQKKLVISAVVTLMTPLFIYFVLIAETYSYLLAFFTVVLSLVLLYAAKNTHNYLVKSRYQAYHDHLTSLGNRRYFIELLESSVKQYHDKYTYLLLIDLDYFKTINDTLGHDIGDELLCEVSNRMKTLSAKYNNDVARLGGDEFCILSKSFDSRAKCLDNATKFSYELLDEIKRTYIIEGNHLYISSSIGVSIVNNPKLQAKDFLKEADIAMYEAKNSGRDGLIIFNDELCELIEKKLDIERLLHFAIEKNEISLVYQPQVDVKQEVIGCEVLVRWNNDKLGFVPPDQFIPVAESTGYIVELGEYILVESLKTLNEWCEKGIYLEQISINMSMRQLLHKDFIYLVENVMKKYIHNDCRTKIIFEITETSAAEDLKKLVSVIKSLKKFNISFSMDDFGTGYSSLSYLREIPLDELKIDRSFISEISDNQQASLVKTIIDISKNLNLKIVAEGVEEDYQKEFLKKYDCDLYQGYLFSKPIEKSEFEKLL